MRRRAVFGAGSLVRRYRARGITLHVGGDFFRVNLLERRWELLRRRKPQRLSAVLHHRSCPFLAPDSASLERESDGDPPGKGNAVPSGLKLSAKVMDLDACIERCCAMELLEEDEIAELCARLKEILMDAPNVSMIASPVTVVGDIHGQFQDLLELFRVGGPCPLTNYLFLGDYVDRGNHSVLTITLLACLNVRYPARITLLVSTAAHCLPPRLSFVTWLTDAFDAGFQCTARQPRD